MPEIQQADPDARAQAIRLLAAGAVIGAALIAAVTHFEALIQDWLLRHLDDLVAHPGKVILVGLLVVAPLLVMALYLFRFGRRVAQAARMPPPGCAVIRDTQVLTGAPALARGRLIQCSAVLMGLLAAAMPAAFWYLLLRVVAGG